MILEFFPLPLLMGIAFLGLLTFLRWQKKRSWFDLFCFTMFGLYLLAVIYLVLFPIPLRQSGEWRMPVTSILARIHWMPFHFGRLFDMPPMYAIRELGGNILLTVPFGLGLPFLRPVNARNLLLLAPVAGLAIEIAQLMVSVIIGSAYRGVDINDVLLNAIGAILGYSIYRLFAWLYRAVIRQFKLNHMR